MDCAQLNVVGTADCVLIREVSFIQRWICAQLNVVGTADSVLIRKVSFIQRWIVHSSMWLGQQTVPSLERCPLFRGGLCTAQCGWDSRLCPH